MKSSAKKIELASVDDLFSTEESRQDEQLEKIQEIPLSELHPFKDHPFKVKDDDAMIETADSIKKYGVLVPAIARPLPDGGYELVAGHRRRRASELAGKETMPVIVRDLDDDAATIIMVDSNLQRENLLPSERAFAYKMKLEAIKHQGARTDLTSVQVEQKLSARDQVAKEAGERSGIQVMRYVRLTELIPELLEMTVVTLGMVFCDTGKVSTKEERLDWPVTDEERNSDKGWGRFQNEQICRLKIRRMKEEWAKDLVAWPWCISQVVKAHEDCPELQAVLDEYHKPVVIQDEVLGELKLDKDYDTFEGEIQWCGTDVSLSLEVNAESKPSWTRARSAAKKLLADCDTWDKAMRELAAKNLTELANNWLSQDEGNPRNPETDPITEEELARRISMTSLSVTSGGSFTAWFDCDEMFTDHAVTVYGSLKKGLKAASIEG